jgi:class 3 adenylate cyclase
MSGDPYVPRMPEHPELRQIAEVIEATGMMAEVFDARYRCVFVSTETLRMVGGADAVDVDALLGRSLFVRNTLTETADTIRVTDEAAAAWARHNVPIVRYDVQPGDPDFEEVFGIAAGYAGAVTPVDPPPRAWHDIVAFPDEMRFRRTLLGDMHQAFLRINDDTGALIGFIYLYRGAVGDSLLHRLGRGDPGLYQRMERVSEPGRRAAAILFADLEASGVLSRRLSSRAYFDLVRDLTDLIDTAVIARSGIVGKHAGDGGSALFLAEEFAGSESAAARAAIEAARAIRDGSATLGPGDVEVQVNAGLHWGATLMIGQVATTGRLEVTALGDQMNECARIEGAAREGAILASKDLVERLGTSDAEATGLDPDALAYTMLGEIDGASDKAVRDAGAIAVTAV